MARYHGKYLQKSVKKDEMRKEQYKRKAEEEKMKTVRNVVQRAHLSLDLFDHWKIFNAILP